MAINLLPTSYSKKSGLGKTLDITKKALVYSSLVLVLFLIASILAILLTTSSLSQQKDQENALVGEVKSLESVEQKLFLTLDRIGKYKELSSLNSNRDAIESLNKVSELAINGVDIFESEITSNTSKVTITATNSKALAEFLAKLVGDGIYKEIDLQNFSFNPSTGYLVTFEAQ